MTWIDGTGYVVSPLDGVNDILIAVVDGREGFPEAIAAVYPQTVVGCSSVSIQMPITAIAVFGVRDTAGFGAPCRLRVLAGRSTARPSHWMMSK
jgi:hypothetical protein